jgi:hypothetical protein
MSRLRRRARHTVDGQLLKRTLALGAACLLVTATMAQPGQVVTEDRPMAMQQCPVCGEGIDDLSVDFCPSCGEAIDAGDVPSRAHRH